MASITKNPLKSGKSWWTARYRDPSGDSQQETFPRKVDAERFLIEIEADMARGLYVPPRAGKVKLRDWYATWESGRSHVRPSTAARDKSYIANHILPVFGDRQLSSLRPSEINSWIKGMTTNDYAPATVRKAAQLLTCMLEAAVADGLLASNPAKGKSLPKLGQAQMRFLTADEVWLLANGIDPRYRALVVVGAFTGLRPGELRGLRIDDLNMLRRQLTVNATMVEISGHVHLGTPKTSASRRTINVPIFVMDEIGKAHPSVPIGRRQVHFHRTAGRPDSKGQLPTQNLDTRH